MVARCCAVARRRQRTPAPGADPRRRQLRPIATNKPATSAAARRPPIATPSAAQAAGAGRAPRRSISHAHRWPRRGAAASRSRNISSIFPRKRISRKRNRRRRPAGGASGSVGSRVAPLTGFPRKRIRRVGAPLARTRIRSEQVNAGTPGAGRDRPGSSTAPPGKILKRKQPAPPAIQHPISAGAIRSAGRIRQPLAKG